MGRLGTQVWLLFGILLANFLAQVVYYFHLYYRPDHLMPDLRSTVLMGSVFALFMAGFVLLITRHRAGYYLTLLFVTMEFLFYLWSNIGSVLHGYGLFFQLSNPDPILWVVFAIGYLNFFASGYFLWLLLRDRRQTFLTASR